MRILLNRGQKILNVKQNKKFFKTTRHVGQFVNGNTHTHEPHHTHKRTKDDYK